jgi:3D (Asp-Asp-Asp) domain-containing protein
MDCSAKTIKIRKKRYFLWLMISGITTGVICFCLQINADTAGAVPLNGRLPLEEQFLQTLPEVAPISVVLFCEANATQDSEQQLLDLLKRSSLAVEPSLAQSAPARTTKTPQWKTVRMLVTGYCACPKCCGKSSDGITANMHRIRPGDVFVAADKKVPFGTRIVIPGYNRGRSVEVKDRGGLIRDNHLDLYFSSHKTAQKWGAKRLDVRIRLEE